MAPKLPRHPGTSGPAPPPLAPALPFAPQHQHRPQQSSPNLTAPAPLSFSATQLYAPTSHPLSAPLPEETLQDPPNVQQEIDHRESPICPPNTRRPTLIQEHGRPDKHKRSYRCPCCAARTYGSEAT